MKDLLTFAEAIVGLILAVGVVWAKIKMAERLNPGLDRKSSIQTLFGDQG